MTDPWLSFHAFHPGDLDRLLVEAVAPHVGGRPWFYLRYWEGGPHLRVRLQAPSGADLVESMRKFLVANPAPPALSASDYAALAADLAGREGVSAYERSLREPGTVAAVPYRPEVDAYGDGPSLAAVERHFVESSELALEIVAAGAARSRRLGTALTAGLIALAVAEPDLERITGALAATGWDESAAPRWEAAFARQRDALRSAALHAFSPGGASPGGATSAGGATTRWERSVRDLRERLDTCFAAGHPAPVSSGSPLGWQVGHLPPAERAAATVVLRCAHLFGNRLGLTVADEMHVNFLIARVLADLGHTGWENHT